MPSLAVFDFDRTVVLDDSDATLINKLKENQPPPEWEGSNKDWTPYMNDVFEHAFTAGMSQEEILSCIGSMRPTPGIEHLITSLANEGWDILVLTDANTVFVNHWFKVHGLLDCITSIVTNRAFFEHGRLFIEPCMHQVACPRCPTNLCKSLALAQWLAKNSYERIVYTGDGRNDYCPSTNLPFNSIVFPRRGFPLDDLTKKTLATSSPQVKAKVVPWDDCYQIVQELFPAKSPAIPS